MGDTLSWYVGFQPFPGHYLQLLGFIQLLACIWAARLMRKPQKSER